MEKIDTDERLLSVTEASNFLGVSKVTLRRILRREEIGFFRVGARILFSKNDHLLKYLRRCEKEPKTEVE